MVSSFSSLHLVHVFVVLKEGVPVGPANNRLLISNAEDDSTVV